MDVHGKQAILKEPSGQGLHSVGLGVVFEDGLVSDVPSEAFVSGEGLGQPCLECSSASGLAHRSVEPALVFSRYDALLALRHFVTFTFGAVFSMCPFLGNVRVLAPHEPALFFRFEWHSLKKMDLAGIVLFLALPP